MIVKKVSIDVLGGKRDKQQVLKDFARPSAASTTSSSPSISTGSYGGDIPGCAGGKGSVPSVRKSCAEDQSIWDDTTPLIAGSWGDNLGSMGWNVSFPDQTSSFEWATHLPDYASAGSLEATGSPGAMSEDDQGSRVYARMTWDDVSERIAVLYTLSWSALGEVAEGSTQHALNFSVRNPDFRSNTAVLYSGVNSAPSSDVADQVGSHDVRIVWKEYPARGLPSSYLQVTGAGSIAINPPITTGVRYHLFIESTGPSTIQATFWRASDPDTRFARSGSSSSVFPPNLSIENAFTANGPNKVQFHAAFVNPPTSTPWLDFDPDCDPGTNEPGVFVQNLFRKDYYWRPQYTNVAYYTSVYFDGFAVHEGDEYRIEDGYKIVPTDNELPVTTVVTASGVYT